MRKQLKNYVNVPRIRAKYRLAALEKRSKILDELCNLAGMCRKSIIRILNRNPKKQKKRQGPKPTYETNKVCPILKNIWFAMDQPCSKKLKAALPHWLPFYDSTYGEIDNVIKAKILSISAATIDRLLKPIKIFAKRKRLCGTKPGTLLKNQIPIKVNQWSETDPGFFETDTVAHCGTSLEGDFVWSLTMTDILTGWTENRATWNKGAYGVCEQIKDVEINLPFKIKGFDCDNGSEFLNHHLIRYFTNRPKLLMVQFTRSRPYKKNDNAHVEQKNWTHVRSLFGYDRFGDKRLVALMNDLYKNEWGLYQNHFMPNMKCVDKIKVNSKYKKKFDEPKTSYERALACEKISKQEKEKLKEIHKKLNPFELKARIEEKLRRIFKLVEVKRPLRKRK